MLNLPLLKILLSPLFDNLLETKMISSLKDAYNF
jgi:hypothetical protein